MNIFRLGAWFFSWLVPPPFQAADTPIIQSERISSLIRHFKHIFSTECYFNTNQDDLSDSHSSVRPWCRSTEVSLCLFLSEWRGRAFMCVEARVCVPSPQTLYLCILNRKKKISVVSQNKPLVRFHPFLFYSIGIAFFCSLSPCQA